MRACRCVTCAAAAFMVVPRQETTGWGWCGVWYGGGCGQGSEAGRLGDTTQHETGPPTLLTLLTLLVHGVLGGDLLGQHGHAHQALHDTRRNTANTAAAAAATPAAATAAWWAPVSPQGAQPMDVQGRRVSHGTLTAPLHPTHPHPALSRLATTRPLAGTRRWLRASWRKLAQRVASVAKTLPATRPAKPEPHQPPSNHTASVSCEWRRGGLY